MEKYTFSFNGRLNTSIGITYRCIVTVVAENATQARLKLYDTHEHISNLKLIGAENE